MTPDKIAVKRIDELEKKIAALVKTNAKIQIQVDDHLARIDKMVEKIRKALPHVNFEGS